MHYDKQIERKIQMLGDTEPHYQQAIKRGPRGNKLTSSTSEAFPYGCNNANDMKALVQHALQ